MPQLLHERKRAEATRDSLFQPYTLLCAQINSKFDHTMIDYFVLKCFGSFPNSHYSCYSSEMWIFTVDVVCYISS